MELALCLKMITELYNTSGRKDDNCSQGQSKPQSYVLAAVLQVDRTKQNEI